MHLSLMRDPARQMPPVADPEAYDSVRIWHCKYRTLAPLGALRHVRALAIATVPDDTLAFLGACRNLEWLSLLHMPKITDLRPLAGLPNLRFLELQTSPGWDAAGKRTVVDSLDPLADIPRLEHLSLIGVVAPDKSLAPIENCRSLVSARMQGVPRQEIDRLFKVTGWADKHLDPPAIASWPP